MKRLFTFVITMLLGATLAFAQTGGGTTAPQGGDQPTTGKKGHKKAHKGGKKHKKGSGDTSTAPPPK